MTDAPRPQVVDFFQHSKAPILHILSVPVQVVMFLAIWQSRLGIMTTTNKRQVSPTFKTQKQTCRAVLLGPGTGHKFSCQWNSHRNSTLGSLPKRTNTKPNILDIEHFQKVSAVLVGTLRGFHVSLHTRMTKTQFLQALPAKHPKHTLKVPAVAGSSPSLRSAICTSFVLLFMGFRRLACVFGTRNLL